MKEIFELVPILNRYQVVSVKILTNEKNRKGQRSKYYELFEAICSKEVTNIDHIANFIGTAKKSRKLKRFLKEFKNRLYYSLLFMADQKRNDNYFDGRGMLNIKLAAIKNYTTLGGNEFAIIELKRILKDSIKKQYYNIALDVLQTLKAKIATNPKYQKEYFDILQQYKKIETIRNNELKAINSYEHYVVLASSVRGTQSHLLPLLKKYMLELEDVDEELRSRSFTDIYNRLKLYYLFSLGDHDKVIEHASKAFHSISKPEQTGAKYDLYLLTMAMSQMLMNKFNDARSTILNVSQSKSDGTKSWFKTKEIEVTNELYAGEYLTAWKITKEIIKHARFHSISQLDQETWKSFYAYLCFLIRAGAFEVSNRERGEANQLKVAVLQQEMPLYNKDKRGANISLLILQILFDLLDKDTELVVNRIEALRKYKQRNLDTEHEHYRTDCFIRMLEMVVKHHFNHKKVLERTPKWLDKLKEKPRDFSSQHYEVEILPYETLWEWVLKLTKAVWA